MSEAIIIYSNALQQPVAHREFLVEADLDIAFFDLGESSIELLCPTNMQSGGSTAKFIKSRGPGIHHLAFKVADVKKELLHYESLGHTLIDTTPRASVRNTLIAFIHPQCFQGTLIELVQHL